MRGAPTSVHQLMSPDQFVSFRPRTIVTSAAVLLRDYLEHRGHGAKRRDSDADRPPARATPASLLG
jgi:hypothetical protein